MKYIETIVFVDGGGKLKSIQQITPMIRNIKIKTKTLIKLNLGPIVLTTK